jgi:nucleotidyltransferase/DNA polymerase involved in DNA repair
MKQFGPEGRRLWRLARGVDDRKVVADRGAKTISNETTLESDVRDFPTLEKIYGGCASVFRRVSRAATFPARPSR